MSHTFCFSTYVSLDRWSGSDIFENLRWVDGLDTVSVDDDVAAVSFFFNVACFSIRWEGECWLLWPGGQM